MQLHFHITTVGSIFILDSNMPNYIFMDDSDWLLGLFERLSLDGLDQTVTVFWLFSFFILIIIYYSIFFNSYGYSYWCKNSDLSLLYELAQSPDFLCNSVFCLGSDFIN